MDRFSFSDRLRAIAVSNEQRKEREMRYQIDNSGSTHAHRLKVEQERRLEQQEKERDRRNKAHQGTLPEEVFSAEQASVCREFVSFMNERGFPGSKLLQEQIAIRRGPFTYGRTYWSIRGYPVGYTPNTIQIPAGSRVTSPPEPNIFLCEDGALRSGTSALPVDSEGPMSPYIGRWVNSGQVGSIAVSGDGSNAITEKFIPVYQYEFREEQLEYTLVKLATFKT